MIEYFVIVAIQAGQLQTEFITPDGYGNKAIDYNKRIRVYNVLHQARRYRTRLRNTNPPLKQGGADYKIVRLRIHADGTLESEWVE